MNNWKIRVDIRLLLLVALALVVIPSVVSQQQQWQFIADRPVSVHADRSPASELLGIIPAGGVLTLTGPYVYAHELIWARLAQADGFAAVARYGRCEIRSFGRYNPPSQAPVSLGE